MIIVPIIFEPQLVNLKKEEANKDINATVDFESIGLNLFENFPNLSFQLYEIKDGTILYNNQSSGIQVVASHLDHNGNGDFTQDQFQLLTYTKISDLSVGFGGINYLIKVRQRFLK